MNSNKTPEYLPAAFRTRMQQQMGEEYTAFEAALLAEPPVSVRFNPGYATTDRQSLAPVGWCPAGAYLQARPDFYKDPAIFGGAYYVQEASSMFLDHVLRTFGDFSTPMKVLDLCAAPGGKSTLINSLLNEQHLLVSNEIVSKRISALQENLMRWGHSNYVVSNNAPADFANLRDYFDTIVTDAPCSGEGMFRKDPGAVDYWSENLVKSCAVRQWHILQDIVGSLKPGGLLVYSTCTFSPDENEDIVRQLAETGSFRPVQVPLEPQWGITETVVATSEGEFAGYRFYPHKARGEGFFMACLQRTLADSSGRPPRKKRKKFVLEPLPKKFLRYVEPWLQQPQKFSFMLHNDDLYAIPAALKPAVLHLADLLSLRSFGLLMGKFRNQKLLPSHHLALCRQLSDKIATVELDYQQAVSYLKKLDFELDLGSLKGWIVVKYQGVPLGWIKAVPGRFNNNYPKAFRLRKNFEF